MKIYQIVEDYDNEKHAGSKATNDAVSIFSELNFERVPISINNRSMSPLDKVKRQLQFFKDWRRVFDVIEPNSILVLQNPFRIRQLGRYQVLMRLKNEKKVQIVSLIHDVELLRYDDRKNRKEFQETLTIADQLIVHNQNMKRWFVEQGVSEDKLIILEIFDYLSNKSKTIETTFSRHVNIAGNLATDKSPYVYDLDKIENVKFDLLGVNYHPTKDSTNVRYRGSFAPEEVPHQLNSGFGLVWDGPSIKSCIGETGEYLRYNNPHKLSLYISSYLPIIIWSGAAEADFVKKYGLGLTIDSLYDLEERLSEVTEEDYYQMVEQTKVIQQKLQSGYYLKKAVAEALHNIKNNK